MGAVSMEENLAYGCPNRMDMNINKNDAYDTNVAKGAVSMEENLAYVEVRTSTHLSTPSHVHQQQDMELTQNQAYVTNTNEGYGAATPPTYATVD